MKKAENFVVELWKVAPVSSWASTRSPTHHYLQWDEGENLSSKGWDSLDQEKDSLMSEAKLHTQNKNSPTNGCSAIFRKAESLHT